jgi:aminoglycoside phosphotransferase
MSDKFGLRDHPAFSSFAQVMPLAGFSGALIALVRTPGGAQFVRKAATTEASNAALEKQARRQAWLRGRIAGAADVPEVLAEDTVEGCYYFDMDFVPSRDANAFLVSASLEEVKQFAASVEELMRHLSSLPLDDVPAPSLAALSRKVADIDALTQSRHQDLLEPILTAIERLECFSSRPNATVSHGDLTFENILVSSKRTLWLIDPIQSPVDHFWLDWSKLFQECEGRWYGHRGKPLSAGITHWLRNRWLETAGRISPDYPARHYLLLALTFARILPYTKTSADVSFVSQRVKAFGQAALQHT